MVANFPVLLQKLQIRMLGERDRKMRENHHIIYQDGMKYMS